MIPGFFLIVSVLFTPCSSKTNNISITTIPGDARVQEGANLTITCIHEAGVAFSVSLFLNNQEVDPLNNPRVSVSFEDAHNKTYIYSFVMKTESGLTFSCHSTKIAEDKSEDVSLEVLYKPEYGFIYQNYQTEETNTFAITANLSANPDVNQVDTIWRKDSNLLDAAGRIQINRTALTIENVHREDAGIYTITGSNTVGTDNASFSLIVYFGPDFIMKGCILTLTVGEKLMIDCRVAESGSNPKNVSITLRGTNLTERNVNYNQSYTVVEMVTDEFNGTTYTCEASNGVTEQQIVYTVIVGHKSITTQTIATSTSSASTFSSYHVRPTPNGKDISSGEIAGIVIGAFLFLVLLACAFVLICLCIWKVCCRNREVQGDNQSDNDLWQNGIFYYRGTVTVL